VSIFTDQVVVMSGATGGVGQALTANLAAREASLFLVGRNLERIKAVPANAGADKQRVSCYRTDLTVVEEIGQFATSLSRGFLICRRPYYSVSAISVGLIEEALAKGFSLAIQDECAGSVCFNSGAAFPPETTSRTNRVCQF